ncbi:MAG: hypothetical protein BWZ10_02462 [candidate division BRC1 bacterium ADurb.BinA364]|nr:MAG: hypothetical protein BWZ10_02462 [candidate division BRC1 bacterium ADurb.BinA364]
MRAARGSDRALEPANFYEWTVAALGQGIADRLSRPFNEKVWTVPMEEMDWRWLSDRVSVVDAERLVANAILDRDDDAWGPNSEFVFPRQGGTGAIWEGVARYASESIRYGMRAAAIDPAARRVRFETGETLDYEWLISTQPLDRLVEMAADAPDRVKEAARSLQRNRVEIVGIGLEKPMDSSVCWMYTPEAETPLYRITNFARYSSAHVPGGDTSRYCSYMCEAPHSAARPLPPGDLFEQAEETLARCGLIEPDDRRRVVSRFRHSIEYAYPIPTLGRDHALAAIQPWLEERRILSRGRFGSWRYEIGNMDHCAQMGKEAVDRIVFGQRETTLLGEAK